MSDEAIDQMVKELRHATGALLLIFITLKLCELIAWSWWWVLAPLWAPFSLAFLGLAWGEWRRIQ
jgi:hypothetical protein